MTLYCITINDRLAPVVPSYFRTIAILDAEFAGLTGYKVEQRTAREK